MFKTSKLKKVLTMVLALALIVGVCGFKGATPASAATSKVSLYSSSVHFAKYGGRSFEVFIKTTGNASDEKVTVHYQYYSDSEWLDAKAVYMETLSDGSKIWRAYFSSFSCKYAIKYEADGEVYWDNNNGNDYDGSEIIGSAPVAVERLGYQYDYSNFKINAVVKNFAYNKNVVVRYTTDGWKTYKEQNLSYNKTNTDGSETWTTSINVKDVVSDDFEYAIRYEVNGNTYWANYCGDNYDFGYCIHH